MTRKKSLTSTAVVADDLPIQVDVPAESVPDLAGLLHIRGSLRWRDAVHRVADELNITTAEALRRAFRDWCLCHPGVSVESSEEILAATSQITVNGRATKAAKQALKQETPA
jgi:hypothetical protein